MLFGNPAREAASAAASTRVGGSAIPFGSPVCGFITILGVWERAASWGDSIGE